MLLLADAENEELWIAPEVSCNATTWRYQLEDGTYATNVTFPDGNDTQVNMQNTRRSWRFGQGRIVSRTSRFGWVATGGRLLRARGKSKGRESNRGEKSPQTRTRVLHFGKEHHARWLTLPHLSAVFRPHDERTF